MVEFVLVWYKERCQICRCWQECFILSPCTLNQLFGCWYAWHLFLNGLTSESDWPVNLTARLKNLRRQFHCIQGSTFLGCFNFGNFHTCCVAPVGVVTESVYDDVVYIRVESALTTAYHTSPKLLRTISWKAWKVNMNPSSMTFFLPREVSVLSMTQIWWTGLRTVMPGYFAKTSKCNWKTSQK